MSIRQKTVQLSNNDDAQDYESDEPPSPSPSELTSLLPPRSTSPDSPPCDFTPGPSPEKRKIDLRVKAREWSVTAMQSIPAVFLGSLLNILDGVSCEYAPCYRVL